MNLSVVKKRIDYLKQVLYSDKMPFHYNEVLIEDFNYLVLKSSKDNYVVVDFESNKMIYGEFGYNGLIDIFDRIQPVFIHGYKREGKECIIDDCIYKFLLEDNSFDLSDALSFIKSKEWYAFIISSDIDLSNYFGSSLIQKKYNYKLFNNNYLDTLNKSIVKALINGKYKYDEYLKIWEGIIKPINKKFFKQKDYHLVLEMLRVNISNWLKELQDYEGIKKNIKGNHKDVMITIVINSMLVIKIKKFHCESIHHFILEKSRRKKNIFANLDDKYKNHFKVKVLPLVYAFFGFDMKLFDLGD